MSDATGVIKQTPRRHRRVHVICEGQTEEMFVNLMLQPHFDTHKIEVHPKLLGEIGYVPPAQRHGGNVSYKRVMTDIRLLLANDPTAYVTTFIDFYGIYADFPGVSQAKKLRTAEERHDTVVNALFTQLAVDLGKEQASHVVPYIQMHEFEGLLFSSPQDMASGILQPHLWKRFDKILFTFDTPEDINDSIETAPSKRIQNVFRGYQKVLHGSIIARRIGLERIRKACPLFDEWLYRLEQLP